MAAWNSSQPRIEALRARWDRDPSSRLSLQLAEEYRRSGDLDQAMHVLRKGIETTPSIAAEVALGRCLLEANDVAAAKVHLGRAIERDPTQMVAYRHLIEVHTRLGDHEEAEAALDIYRQLNPTDPELDDLAARLTRPEPEAEEDSEPTTPSSSGFGEAAPASGETTLPPMPSGHPERASGPGVETATFQPLSETEPPPAATPEVSAPPTPPLRSSGKATPFVSFLDRAENESELEAAPETESVPEPEPEPELEVEPDLEVEPEPEPEPEVTEPLSEAQAFAATAFKDTVTEHVVSEDAISEGPVSHPPVPRAPDPAPSRFGFAGTWPEDEVRAEETVPFFEPENPVFQAPEPGDLEHAVVIEAGQLFALEEIERDEFELFALPSRPLRRPRRRAVMPSAPGEAESGQGPTQTPTQTLSKLYREQGHEEEAERLERQAQGVDSPEVAADPELKAVDFAPLRQLQGVRGVARRRLVVTGYLNRLTEARDVS